MELNRPDLTKCYEALKKRDQVAIKRMVGSIGDKKWVTVGIQSSISHKKASLFL